MVVKFGFIENRGRGVGLPLTGLSAQKDVSIDLFVGAGCIKAVWAREVDQFDGTPITEVQAAGLPFHRNPGIIAKLLPCAGKSVEECAFSSIGIAYESNQGNPAHVLVAASGRTVMAAA